MPMFLSRIGVAVALVVLSLGYLATANEFEADRLCRPLAGTEWQMCTLMNSKITGAVCLDGSAFSYFFRAASTPNGQSKWQVYFQGGGWCYDLPSCAQRSTTYLGSSTYWEQNYTQMLPTFSGMISSNPSTNPNFFDWNTVYLPYCDAGSWAGDVDVPVVYNGTSLYFRGHRMLVEVYTQLKGLGMNKATDVLVSGMSAGGLATFLHVDAIASWLPQAKVFGVPDSGFFLDLPDVTGAYHMRDNYISVYKMQNATAGVNAACVAALGLSDSWRCFYAPYSMPFIKSPLYVLNSLYDSWSLGNIIAPNNDWGWFGACLGNQSSCSKTQIAAANTLYDGMMNAIDQYQITNIYAIECWSHVIALYNPTWDHVSVKDELMYQAVGKWYENDFKGNPYIDSKFPGGCKRTQGRL